MLRRTFFPKLDLIDVKVKPNSKEVDTDETAQLLQDTVAHLIAELTGKPFQLETSVASDGFFSVQISRSCHALANINPFQIRSSPIAAKHNR